jgi:hypothetical protein
LARGREARLRTLYIGVETPGEELAGEAWDPDGNRVVVPAPLWQEKVLRDHPELGPHLTDVLRAISRPDQICPDPTFDDRRRHYLRNAGPSRWMLVVLSYEQEPARLITAFPNRKDPPSWSR